jgi:hypothetical protein
MATDYFWEVGFDFNNDPDPENDNKVQLQNGLVEVSPNHQLGDLEQTRVNDTLGFRAFNVTTFNSNQDPSAYSITDVSIRFSNADDQSPPCPIDESEPVPLDDNRTTDVHIDGNSATINFGSLGPSEADEPSTFFTNESEYPVWPLVSPLSLISTGSFNVTLLLTVQGPNASGATTTKTFRADPEMIVEGVGGGS